MIRVKSPDLESLPQELKDLIVDHISHIPDDAERRQTLRATALVSRRFRHWAHKRLFATVVLRGRFGKAASTVISRVQELKELIAADPRSEYTGIASHIRSFTLSLGGHRSSVLPPLEDDALPFILQKLHRSGSRPRSLSILLFMPGDNDQLDWSSLNQDLRRALVDVAKSPLLSTLRLRGFKNLPHDILAGSSVDNIKFNNISVKDYSQDEYRGSLKDDQLQFLCNEGASTLPQESHAPDQASGLETQSDIPADIGSQSRSVVSLPIPSVPSPSAESDLSCIHHHPDYVHLETIETDHAFPILHVLDLTPSRSHSAMFIYQRLKYLTMNIRNDFGFEKSAEIFDTAPFVEKLEIKLNCTVVPGNALSFQSLRYLKHLRLIHRLATSGFNNLPAGITHPNIQDIINLLTYSEIPTSLRRISITLLLKPPSYYCTLFQIAAEEGIDSNNPNSNSESSNGANLSFTPLTDPVKPCSMFAPPPTMLLIKRVFSNFSSVLQPLDELLGHSSSTQTPDRFAHINYYTIRLEVDLYTVPKWFTKHNEREFAEEAAEYVKSHFFPRLNERFQRVTSEIRSGGFGVVVTPRPRNQS